MMSEQEIDEKETMFHYKCYADISCDVINLLYYEFNDNLGSNQRTIHCYYTVDADTAGYTVFSFYSYLPINDVAYQWYEIINMHKLEDLMLYTLDYYDNFTGEKKPYKWWLRNLLN